LTDKEAKGLGTLGRILSGERVRPKLPLVFCLVGGGPTGANQPALLARRDKNDIVLIGRRILP
jgi:hypothetical protein